MNIKFLLLTGLIFISIQLSAQSAAQAEVFFNSKKYKDAAKAYETLLIRRPNDAMLNYRYGRCMLELKMYDKAVEHLRKSGNKYPERDFYLSEALYRNYDFLQAFDLLKEYAGKIDSTASDFREVQKKLPVLELTARLINRVEDIVITDSIMADKKDFLKHYNLLSEAGKLVQKSIPVGAKLLDEISYFTQRGDRHIQSAWMNGHWDINTSIKLLNDWSEPVSISNMINTKQNENYPFLLSDGITFYFASDGHGSIGGYDIFVTKYSSNTKDFVNPENIGFPFNSFANDYMLALDETAQLGWFATDRNQKTGKVMIYQFQLMTEKSFVAIEDSVRVKNTARLKSYKKGVKAAVNLSDSDPKHDVLLDNVKQIFVINDSVNYNDRNDFKSPEALKLYDEWLKLDAEIRNISMQLSGLRTRYENAENETDKISISASILQNEEKLIVSKLKSKELSKNIRSEENKKISAN